MSVGGLVGLGVGALLEKQQMMGQSLLTLRVPTGRHTSQTLRQPVLRAPVRVPGVLVRSISHGDKKVASFAFFLSAESLN